MRIINPDGTTTCCNAFSSIDEDGIEYCKACFEGVMPITNSFTVTIK